AAARPGPRRAIPEPQEACPQSQWSQALAQYLETCIARHDALFSGQCSPLELLFNEQHRVTAGRGRGGAGGRGGGGGGGRG
ncbi:hypothetical protein NQU33_26595, partial [Escherichia coli]|nr:hypothetical protein [Escherichia coli]